LGIRANPPQTRQALIRAHSAWGVVLVAGIRAPGGGPRGGGGAGAQGKKTAPKGGGWFSKGGFLARGGGTDFGKPFRGRLNPVAATTLGRLSDPPPKSRGAIGRGGGTFSGHLCFFTGGGNLGLRLRGSRGKREPTRPKSWGGGGGLGWPRRAKLWMRPFGHCAGLHPGGAGAIWLLWGGASSRHGSNALEGSFWEHGGVGMGQFFGGVVAHPDCSEGGGPPQGVFYRGFGGSAVRGTEHFWRPAGAFNRRKKCFGPKTVPLRVFTSRGRGVFFFILEMDCLFSLTGRQLFWCRGSSRSCRLRWPAGSRWAFDLYAGFMSSFVFRNSHPKHNFGKDFGKCRGSIHIAGGEIPVGDPRREGVSRGEGGGGEKVHRGCFLVKLGGLTKTTLFIRRFQGDRARPGGGGAGVCFFKRGIF